MASWEPSWGPPLEELVEGLGGSSEQGMPVIVAGGALASRPLYVDGALVPVRHVAQVEAFPGMGSSRPLLVTSYDAIERAAEEAGIGNPLQQPAAATLVWGKGPPAEVAEALRTSPLGPYYIQTTETFLADSDVAAETRTFSYLRALGIAAGLLTVVGLVLYLQARQRRTVVAAALSRRMGLGQASQALALSLELGAILLVATRRRRRHVGHRRPLRRHEGRPARHLPARAALRGAVPPRLDRGSRAGGRRRSRRGAREPDGGAYRLRRGDAPWRVIPPRSAPTSGRRT